MYGIDGSSTAIEVAKQRFREDGLKGEFHVGSFAELPFPNNFFHLIIDRGALTCVSLSVAKTAIREIKRVAKEGALFFFNPYSKEHTSCLESTPGSDGIRLNLTGGSLKGIQQLCFYDKGDMDRVIGDEWKTNSCQHLVIRELVDDPPSVHSEWRLILQK